jgi:hypothetical protein
MVGKGMSGRRPARNDAFTGRFLFGGLGIPTGPRQERLYVFYNGTDESVGTIEWKRGLRSYAFLPEEGASLDVPRMLDVIAFMNKLQDRRDRGGRWPRDS